MLMIPSPVRPSISKFLIRNPCLLSSRDFYSLMPYICLMEEVQRLKDYFNSVEIPKGKIKINRWLTSLDLKSTISAYLNKAESGGRFYDTAILRLQEIEGFLKERNN